MNTLQSATSTSLRLSVRGTLNKVKRKQVSSVSASTELSVQPDASSKKIVIPTRIERGPTDILRALSSTVQRDYSAPHYKYHDDPFLIPMSNINKRMYALSQESGRKAAHWVRQQNADLFQHKVADPPIEVFHPQAVYDENSEVDEEALKKVISLHQVSDAVLVHELLQLKEIAVSDTTKQSLLELICYYNNQDPLEEDWIEERWFRQGVRVKERKKNLWTQGGVAEKLFHSLATKDAAAYAAVLCGMAAAGNASGAYHYYQEAGDKGVALPTEAFNALISSSPVLKEGHELRWQFVEELLNTMNQQGVTPNLGTLNSVLETISTMSVNRNSQKNALGICAEFRKMGIELSLASYYYLLRIFCQERSQMRSAVLVTILDILGNKPQQIQDPRDIMFFVEAMDVCRYHLSDLDLAYRVDKFLHVGNNYNLIGDSYKESIYYRNFFALLCQMGSLGELLDVYNKLVPHVYVPEPGIMEEVLKVAELNEAWDLLPRLWSDLVMFNQAEREPIMLLLLSALRKSRVQDAALRDKLADVAWGVWQRGENQRESERSQNRLSWTGQMVGDIMTVVLRAGRYSQAIELLINLDKRQQEILGVPSIDSLAAFLDASIENNNAKMAVVCVQYCSDAGFEETVTLAQKLNDSLKLDTNDQARLTSIVGREALQKQSAVS